jgi:hypothetical protein
MNWFGEFSKLIFSLAIVAGGVAWFIWAYHFIRFKAEEAPNSLSELFWRPRGFSAKARLRYGVAMRWMLRFIICAGVAAVARIAGLLWGGWPSA